MKKENSFAATTKNFNNISSNKNFLIFLMDTLDSRAFYDVMSQDEDFKGMFEDFTYYPDTLSLYSTTMNSVLGILTGFEYNQGMTVTDKFVAASSKAYDQSPLFGKLKANSYTINLYSLNVFRPGQRVFKIENTISIHDDIKVNFSEFRKQVWKYVRFKYLPYGYKQYSHIEAMNFNSCKTENKQNRNWSENNSIVYDLIKRNPNLHKENKNYFQYVHILGGHPPFDVDKHLTKIANGSYKDKIASSLTVVKAYLQLLKTNNVYDNSAIVIMADHGFLGERSHNNADMDVIARGNPVLFIKGFNEKHKMIKSDMPVSFRDLQDIFFNLIDGKKSTELSFGLEIGRTRTFFLRNQKSPAWPVHEYITTGKAWEVEKFTPTGK